MIRLQPGVCLFAIVRIGHELVNRLDGGSVLKRKLSARDERATPTRVRNVVLGQFEVYLLDGRGIEKLNTHRNYSTIELCC